MLRWTLPSSTVGLTSFHDAIVFYRFFLVNDVFFHNANFDVDEHDGQNYFPCTTNSKIRWLFPNFAESSLVSRNPSCRCTSCQQESNYEVPIPSLRNMAGGKKVSPAIWSATGTPLDCEMRYRYLYSTVHGQPCVITQQISLLYRRIRISRLPVLTFDCQYKTFVL